MMSTSTEFDVDFAIENMLGRKMLHEPANLDYPIQPRSLVATERPTKKIHWPDRRPSRLHLHQHCSGCTGYGLCTVLNHLPFHKVNTPTFNDQDSIDAYVRATENDPWDWTYDPATGKGDGGSSGPGACKGARDVGWITGWRFAFTESLFWAGMKAGPMYVGTNWYRGMMEPDNRGRLEATGDLVGGHQFCIDDYDPVVDDFEIDQTWGFGWGKKGFARIRRAVLFDLIFNQQGDAIQLVK
jgi:hypothetical protein